MYSEEWKKGAIRIGQADYRKRFINMTITTAPASPKTGLPLNARTARNKCKTFPKCMHVRQTVKHLRIHEILFDLLKLLT